MNGVLSEALRTTALGMGIVLVTLYVLSLILDIMKLIFNPQQKAKKKQEPIQQAEKVTTKDTITQKAVQDDDIELVAVITAALSQYLDKPNSEVKIGAIRQLHKKTPAWGMPARLEKTRLSS